MEGAVVTKIAELAQVQEFVVGEKHFTSKPVHEVEPEPAKLPALISVFTLQGFAELIRQKVDDGPLNYGRAVIQVENERAVALLSAVCDEHGRRLKLVVASPVPFKQFGFGNWHKHEDFIIAVASLFSDTQDRQYVIDVASGLTAGATRTAEDDGLKQNITIKRGMALMKELQVKNRVQLAPYRTFPECQQPVSEFVFRLRGGSDEQIPELAMFEADGGKWKIAAIEEIRRYLTVLNLGLPIVA